METLAKWMVVSLVLTTSTVAMAQKMTQEQQNMQANLISQCPVSKAPAGWDVVTVAIDRSDAEKPVLYNVAHVKGQEKIIDLDVKDCDIKAQINALASFTTIMPEDQKNWKWIYFKTDTSGTYSVFTDIALAKILSKQKK